jgi:hypothetical protein
MDQQVRLQPPTGRLSSALDAELVVIGKPEELFN